MNRTLCRIFSEKIELLRQRVNDFDHIPVQEMNITSIHLLEVWENDVNLLIKQCQRVGVDFKYSLSLREKIAAKQKVNYVSMISDGRGWIRDAVGRFQLVDYHGNILSEEKFLDVEVFEGGVAKVAFVQDVVQPDTGKIFPERRYGFVNTEGVHMEIFPFESLRREREVSLFLGADDTTPPISYWLSKYDGGLLRDEKFSRVGDSGEGYIPVKNGPYYDYLNKNGDWLLDGKLNLSQANPFSEGLAFVQTSEGIYGYMDTSGILKTGGRYGEIFSGKPFSCGIALVQSTQGNSFMTKDGKFIPLAKDYILKDSFCEGLAPVEYEKKIDFIDVSGQIVLEGEATRVHGFQNGFWMIEQGLGKYNFVDSHGKVISQNTFFDAEHFVDGRARVMNAEGKYNYLCEDGTLLLKKWVNRAQNFKDGIGEIQYEPLELTTCIDIYGNERFKKVRTMINFT